jgi:hypothetical protein
LSMQGVTKTLKRCFQSTTIGHHCPMCLPPGPPSSLIHLQWSKYIAIVLRRRVSKEAHCTAWPSKEARKSSHGLFCKLLRTPYCRQNPGCKRSDMTRAKPQPCNYATNEAEGQCVQGTMPLLSPLRTVWLLGSWGGELKAKDRLDFAVRLTLLAVFAVFAVLLLPAGSPPSPQLAPGPTNR